MSDQPDTLVLVYLRRIDARLERMEDDLKDVKRRLTALEESQARMHQDIAAIRGDYAGLPLRMDRFDDRLARIERRLDLAETRP